MAARRALLRFGSKLVPIGREFKPLTEPKELVFPYTHTLAVSVPVSVSLSSLPRPGGSQPARRGLRQRAPSAGLREEEDRGAGPHGGQALRHLQAAPGLPRLRLQDPHQVL